MFFKQDLQFPPWLFDTLLRIEEQPADKRLMIPVGSVRNVGKTAGIIQVIRHLASKQPVNNQKVRKLKIGLLRESYRQFNNVTDSIEEWFEFGDGFDAVSRERSLGFAYKNIDKGPELIWMEKNPDYLSLMMGEEYRWDGTYTKVHIVGFSYNNERSDAHMRGSNLASGWVNEAQTVNPRGVSTLFGAIGRPEGKISHPVLIQDYNLPEAKDAGYHALKNLTQYDGGSKSEGGIDVDIYFPKLPAPYRFRESISGDFTFEGKKGFLDQNDNFLNEAPHLKTLDSYAHYKIMGDDEVRRNLLGMFGRATSGKLVYTEFSRKKHVEKVSLPEPDSNHLILAPIDFGLRPGVLFAYIDEGVPKIFKEFAIEEINFFELLTTYIVPYLEEYLPSYYKKEQIVFIGDPTSGGRRDVIKSATPVNVLLGVTDVNGDEDGDAERFNFWRTIPSPCGNNISHRLNCSKQLLSKPHGVVISEECDVMIEAMEERYVFGPAGNPLKKSNDIYHGPMDCFQYLSAYLYAGMETKVQPKKTKDKKAIKARKRYV